MRVLVYGGSFNPPHVGHALVVAWAVWTDQADEIWVLPTADHPFGKRLAPFARRLRWTEVAMAPLGPRVVVDPVEADLPSPNYTIRTLELLSARRPDAELRLLVGSDLLAEIPRWHRGAELVARFPPLAVGRVGYSEVAGVPTFPGVSSTDVRDRLARSADVSALVPASVLREMTEDDREFYRGPRATTP